MAQEAKAGEHVVNSLAERQLEFSSSSEEKEVIDVR
jgi:hypothetical protein